ncbi:MAG: ankyrin repeat domain-containing protein, partial [Reinekea sp.]|nr:ankyrin repeat domain-containing protein [Reinekea sp.]
MTLKNHLHLLAFTLLCSAQLSAFESTAVTGSWQHDTKTGEEKIRFKADGTFYATTYVQGNIYASRYGTWNLTDETLQLEQTAKVRRAANTEYSVFNVTDSESFTITSVTPQTINANFESIFGKEDVQFSRLTQEVSDARPSEADLKQAQQSLTIEQCLSAFDVYQFASTYPTCLLASTYQNPDALLRLATLYELGLGVQANPSLASFTYKIAQQVGVFANEKPSDHFPELQALLQPDNKPYVGIWCGITDSYGERSIPSTTHFALKPDNTFIYTERAMFRGEYILTDRTIDLGGMVGEMEVLEHSIDRLIVKNNGMTRSFSYTNCVDDSIYRAALLENAIAANLVDLYNEILDQGHDVNLINTQTAYNNSPLLAAIKYGRVDLVARLLEAGADVNYVNESEKDAFSINTSHAKTEIEK